MENQCRIIEVLAANWGPRNGPVLCRSNGDSYMVDITQQISKYFKMKSKGREASGSHCFSCLRPSAATTLCSKLRPSSTLQTVHYFLRLWPFIPIFPSITPDNIPQFVGKAQILRFRFLWPLIAQDCVDHKDDRTDACVRIFLTKNLVEPKSNPP